jgi:dihydroorotase
MNPPLRAERDRQALVEGLRDGTVDAIASDHAPHHVDEKDQQFAAAPFGIVGLETTLSLCLDRLVRPGILELGALVALLSPRPARVMGLPGGTLRVGSPADLTLIDLDREVEVSSRTFRSKGVNTPFEGWQLTGAAVGTICAGRLRRLD